jgi:UDP-2,4-diacetamido-2,4,6-trideoxy-beta-L-altropyranose hydrolase
MSAGRVAIRVDADATIGVGHVTRTLVLARQLAADGFEVRFVCRHRPVPAVEALLRPFAFEWLADGDVPLADEESWDARATIERMGPWLADSDSWVVVYHYALGEAWERAVRDAGARILAIDDFRDRRHCADILVSDTSEPFDPALNSCPDAPRALAGFAYALIGQEFAADDVPRAAATGPLRVLISYGGADPTNETAKALDAIRLLRLAKNSERLGRVDVAVGHVNPSADAVRAQAAVLHDVHVHVAPENFPLLLRESHVFLAAGGNTMIEALAMRRLCVITTVADNQNAIVQVMWRQGAITALGWHASVSAADVAQALSDIVSGYERRMSEVQALSIFDTMGASRISRTIRADRR